MNKPHLTRNYGALKGAFMSQIWND